LDKIEPVFFSEKQSVYFLWRMDWKTTTKWSLYVWSLYVWSLYVWSLYVLSLYVAATLYSVHVLAHCQTHLFGILFTRNKLVLLRLANILINKQTLNAVNNNKNNNNNNNSNNNNNNNNNNYNWILNISFKLCTGQGKGTKGNKSTNTEDGIMVIVHFLSFRLTIVW
jgi:hypothetical protein